MPWDGKYWFPEGYKLNSRDLNNLYIRVFPKIGVPQNGWFIRENPIRGGTLLLERPIYLVWKPPFCYSNDSHPDPTNQATKLELPSNPLGSSPAVSRDSRDPAATPRIPWKLRVGKETTSPDSRSFKLMAFPNLVVQSLFFGDNTLDKLLGFSRVVLFTDPLEPTSIRTSSIPAPLKPWSISKNVMPNSSLGGSHKKRSIQKWRNMLGCTNVYISFYKHDTVSEIMWIVL